MRECTCNLDGLATYWAPKQRQASAKWRAMGICTSTWRAREGKLQADSLSMTREALRASPFPGRELESKQRHSREATGRSSRRVGVHATTAPGSKAKAGPRPPKRGANTPALSAKTSNSSATLATCPVWLFSYNPHLATEMRSIMRSNEIRGLKEQSCGGVVGPSPRERGSR